MTIIKYKTFKSSSDFEDWQKEERPNIISIIPTPSQLDIKNNDGEFNVDINAFVTYMEDE